MQRLIGGGPYVENNALRMPSPQEQELATRWTKPHEFIGQSGEDEIIYLHLPCRSTPGSTYIFPLALCPSPLPGKKQ